MPRKPKFKVGQVVSIDSFYDIEKRWRYGIKFAKIVKIVPSSFCPTRYFLEGWRSGQLQDRLRALTLRERGL